MVGEAPCLASPDGTSLVANYLKQMLLIIEVIWPQKITWRSKKRYITIFRKQAKLSLPWKKCLEYT